MKIRNLLIFTLLLTSVNTAFAAVDFSGWSKYGDDLQNCKPGSYSLPDPLQASLGDEAPGFITYQIVGMNADTCNVRVSRTVSPPGEKPITLSLACAFAAANLPALSKSAKDVAAGNISTEDPASKIMGTSCKEAR